MEKRKKPGRKNQIAKFPNCPKPPILKCYENVVRISERQASELKRSILTEPDLLEKMRKKRLFHMKQQELHQGRIAVYRFLAKQRNTFGLVNSLAELPKLIRRERALVKSEKENIDVIGRRIELFPKRG